MHPIPSDSRQRILEAARQLIYSRSYADVGVAEICQAAGVQKGSFYHFFPSKRDLTLAVLDAHYLTFKETIVESAFVPDIPPLARLERFAAQIYTFHQQLQRETGRVLGCPVGNLANELSSFDDLIRAKIAHVFRQVQAQVAAVLQAASDSGELAGLNVEATAQAMFAYFEGVMMLAKAQNDPEVLRQLLPAMAQIRIPSAKR